MSKIERRPFGTYGLPLTGAFGKLFWQGVAWGLVAMSVVIVAISVLGGFSFGAFALSGPAVIKYGLLWAFVYLLVGLAEEFQFHGYTLFTATTGIGFWPSALVLSAIFGAGHVENLGESWPGMLEVLVFSLLCCFTLRRTGNLWFAVGLHAAWDFAEQFLYAVPNSGLRATGTLLNSTMHGPTLAHRRRGWPRGERVHLLLLGSLFLGIQQVVSRENEFPSTFGHDSPGADGTPVER